MTKHALEVLTKEEYEKLESLTEDEILAALEEGRKEYDTLEEYRFRLCSSGLLYRCDCGRM